MIDPLSLGIGFGAAIWICGSGWMFADIADGPMIPPKRIAYLVAAFWPLALVGYCILYIIGLLNEARKGIFSREGA